MLVSVIMHENNERAVNECKDDVFDPVRRKVTDKTNL